METNLETVAHAKCGEQSCKMRPAPSGMKVICEITSRCNLLCRHCLFRNAQGCSRQERTQYDISLEAVDRLFGDLVSRGACKLVLTGGEPTLHPRFLDILRLSLNRIPLTSVCTNGVVRDPALVRALLDSPLNNITVSLDSHDPGQHDSFRGVPGAYEITVALLRQLQLEGQPVTIHVCLHPSNLHSLEDTLSFCRTFTDSIFVSGVFHSPELALAPKDVANAREILQEAGIPFMFPDDALNACPNARSARCPDRKRIVTVNTHSQIVSCYWQKGGGNVIEDMISDKDVQ